MTSFDPSLTVGELVRRNPAFSRVLESLKIDYCCGGNRSLADVCQKMNLNADLLWQQFLECRVADTPDLVDADRMTLSELCDHIEATHHAYLKAEIPRLDALIAKVARVHGEQDPRLNQVYSSFESFRDEVVPHMAKEEKVLFPLIRQIDRHGKSNPDAPFPRIHCGSVANPIRQMVLEHEHAGNELAVMRNLTDDFTPPEWACNTYLATLDALAKLERDMHQHVHKENNVLFPKVADLESRIQGAGAGS